MRDLFGCNLSAATVHRAGNVCSGKLVRRGQRIKAAIRDPAVVGVDETGLRVAGGSGWVDVARTENHTHYVYTERRGKAAMEFSLPLIISFLAPTDLSKRGDLCQSFSF
jgi:transposase